MSKYGVVKSSWKDCFTSEQLKKFAEDNGISYDEAESLANEYAYRKAYAKLRNQDAEVKRARKAYNKKRNALRAMLTQ